jgi:phosphatidate cytidylyltransferase
MQRLLTALALVPLLWLMIAVAPAGVFFGFALIMTSLAVLECYRMLKPRDTRPFRWIGFVAVAALLWSFAGFDPHFEALLPLMAVSLLAVGLAMMRRDTPESMLRTSVDTLFPVLTIALAMGYLVRLRALPDGTGQNLLLLLFGSVVAADTGAYYTGRALGRHKMAPSISPNKTWEGAVGGLLSGIVGALVIRYGLWPELALHRAVVAGLLLAAVGILGDLAVSMLKRTSGVKDSSRLIPGHGGVLDRTDSLLFAAPILYYYYSLSW